MFFHKRLTRPATALLVVVVGVALYALPATSSSAGSPGVPSEHQASRGESSTPSGLLFVENAGQWPEAARFQVWGSPAGVGTTWLADDTIWISIVVGSQVARSPGAMRSGGSQVAGAIALPEELPYLQRATLQPATSPPTGVALKLTFSGANPDVRIEALDPLSIAVSYFPGNDPAQWRPEVPVWGGVRYVDLYPGVDLILGGHEGAWQLLAAPGAAVDQVHLQVEGADILALDGATLQLDGAGELPSIALPSAAFPYQTSGTVRQGELLTLTVYPEPRPSQPARPADDPADLLYGTFLGGSSDDEGYAMAVDGTGSAYVAGETYSSDFPTTPGAFDPSLNGDNRDVFVAKLNPVGSELAYATFLGGSDSDSGRAIAVDETGSAYVTGFSESSDFPTTPGAFDPSYNGDSDVFVAKLNPAGSGLAYATFLGGSGDDFGFAIAVDGPGSAYVTGSTVSSDFPATLGAFDPSLNVYEDAFVAKLNPAGSEMAYATYLGGSDWNMDLGDYGSAIAVDGTGSAYVTGETVSSDFPTTPGAFDTSLDGRWDAFVVKLNSAGSELAYGTFLGGSGSDLGSGIAVDGTGSAYVTGETYSSDFPTTPGAFDPSLGGHLDAFVVKLNPAGSQLAYATFLGGSDGNMGLADGGFGITLDGAGSACVTGLTHSSDFPTTPGVFDPSYNGYVDAFVVKLDPAGSGLTYATFLGGSGDDLGFAVAVDEASSVYAMGSTSSSDFPTTPGAFDPSFNGEYDAFLVKLDLSSPTAVTLVSVEAVAADNGAVSYAFLAALLGLALAAVRGCRQHPMKTGG